MARTNGAQEEMRGWTVEVTCRGCSARLTACALADAWIECPRARSARGPPLDWRLYLRDAPRADAPLARAATDGGALRCTRCEVHAAHVELLLETKGRWRAVALGEATTLRLEPTGAAPAARALAVDGAELVSLWRAGAARFLIDMREAGAFAAAHLRGSTSVPWSALEQGVAGLPVASERVLLLAPAGELHSVLAFVLSRGRCVRAACADCAELWAAAAVEPAPADGEAHAALCMLASEAVGSVSRRAWAPSPLLERHLPLLRPARAAVADTDDAAPPFALDLGCGAGRDALFLAALGWAVVAVDSDARALGRLALLAGSERLTVAHLEPLDAPAAHSARDPAEPPAEATPPTGPSHARLPERLPGGAVWTLRAELRAACEGEGAQLDALPRPDLVLFVRFLHRPLLRWARARIRPGGVVAVAHFLRGAELVGRRRPRLAADLLERGELARLFGGGGAGDGGGGAGGCDDKGGEYADGERGFAGAPAPVGAGGDGAVGEFVIELNDETAEAEDGRPMVLFVARRRPS
ncbi:hypothetical protein KFE25_007763 [Diacronema lutheri]|uniref:Tellurite resistance methyltransferase TehB-like domain-containing protein n=1 Tax=Diacronema lutheri TaxID=2081491 RepID=A0A8J5XWH9_DIALT|nr:hypothetical protein KFE25_007763 [Diacronema lutheri]